MTTIPPSQTPEALHTQHPPNASWRAFALTGILYYYLTSLVAIIGILLGDDYFARPNATGPREADFLKAVTNWDGQFYKQIMVHGYSFNQHKQSSVAFFPAYPLLGRLVMTITGLPPELTLLIVSHVALIAAFITLAAYLRHRFSAMPSQFIVWVLLVFGLFPTTFYSRVAYSESLFLFSSILALYAMERRWPVLAVAGIVGFA